MAQNEDAIASRMVLAQRAQRDAEAHIQLALLHVERYFSYRLLFVPRTVKSRGRIGEKLDKLRATRGDKSVSELLDLVTDLAGGRVLVVGVKDLRQVVDILSEKLRDAGWLPDGDREEFIESSKKPGGFRGVKALKLVPQVAGSFPFELQAMSYLQHSWDLLQHHVYEERRKGSRLDSAVDVRFAKLSDRLYEVDCEIDQIRSDLP